MDENLSAFIEHNPGIIKAALEKALQDEARVAQAQQKQALEKISVNETEDNQAPILGNPNGKITMILFIDPLCGFCRKFHPVILDAIKEIKDLKIIVKDYPIIGGQKSLEIVRMALAARKQGKYESFTNKIYEKTDFSGENLKKIAKSLELNMDQLKQDMENPETIETIKGNIQLGRELGVDGTPAFIIHKKLYAGYRPLSDLKQIILETRNG